MGSEGKIVNLKNQFDLRDHYDMMMATCASSPKKAYDALERRSTKGISATEEMADLEVFRQISVLIPELYTSLDMNSLTGCPT